MSEWQPIETAPRDGTRVLLYVPPYGPSTGHYREHNWGAGASNWHAHSVLNKEAEPTHWLPLPGKPKDHTMSDEGLNRRTEPALSALREARVMLTPLAFEEAEDLCERIDAILSGSPDYSEAVKELVRAATASVICMNQMGTRAYQCGLEGTSDWDKVAFDLHNTREELRKALAPFNEVK